jgi:MFS transporter, NNP family, nitrate/nitrite transporter
MAFIVWFVVSALVVRLPQIGFRSPPASSSGWPPCPASPAARSALDPHVPGADLRHAPRGQRSPRCRCCCRGRLVLAVQDPTTPYWVLMLLAFLAGLGGGNFSSFMPSTSLFFPKRLQGTALAIQAGIGNFGVSVVQFVTPWVIGFALFGMPGRFADHDARRGAEPGLAAERHRMIYDPVHPAFGAVAWILLRKSVPVKANFREQFDIFRSEATPGR